MSLAHLIPRDHSWISDLQEKIFETKHGIISYVEFRDKVFITLSELKVGDVYDISRKVREETIDAFFKIAFHFADINYPRYMFIDNFTKLKRYE